MKNLLRLLGTGLLTLAFLLCASVGLAVAELRASAVLPTVGIVNAVSDLHAVGNGHKAISFLVTSSTSSNTITLAANGWGSPGFGAANQGQLIAIGGVGSYYPTWAGIVTTGSPSGYAAGDTVTLNDGCNPQTVLTIEFAPTSGVYANIPFADVTTQGVCASAPSNPVSQSSTSGSGSGGSWNLYWTNVLYTSISSISGSGSLTLANTPTAALSGVAEFVSWGTDDSANFNNGIVALLLNSTHGGAIYVPPAPNGDCYLVANPVVLKGLAGSTPPGDNNIEFYGSGVSSELCGFGPNIGVLQRDSTYSRGYHVHDLSLNANLAASHSFELLNGGQVWLDHIWFRNALSSNVLLGGTGSNSIEHSYIENLAAYFPSGGTTLPQYGVDVESPDNELHNIQIYDTYWCGVEDNAADTKMVSLHPYGTGSYESQHNYCLNGSLGMLESSNADYSAVSGIYGTGYSYGVLNNYVDNTPIGVELANGLQDWAVVGNHMPGTVGVPIVIDGAGGLGTGSCIFANGGVGAPSGTRSTFAPFSYCGPLVSGLPKTQGSNPLVSVNTASAPLGCIGPYCQVYGAQSFGIGNTVFDETREGCIVHQDKTVAGWAGDNQHWLCTIGNYSTGSNTVYVAAGGPSSITANNEIRLYAADGKTHEETVTAKINAICDTGDYAHWTVTFGLINKGTVASTGFENIGGGSGQTAGGTTTVPTITQNDATTGAATWALALVLDRTNGGAYFTGTGGTSGCNSGADPIEWHGTLDISSGTPGSH